MPICGSIRSDFAVDEIGVIHADQTGLDIDPMTCVPHMTDATMDYGMAVDGPLQRRARKQPEWSHTAYPDRNRLSFAVMRPEQKWKHLTDAVSVSPLTAYP